MRRAALLTFLLVGALASFGLAVWSAVQGRLPIIEMAHAILFTLLALVVAAAPRAVAAGCRECGRVEEPGISFCIGCGRVPRHDARRRATA